MGLDYYKVLFIKKDASEEELKQAYKKMSLLHHPKRQKVERPLTPSYRAREQIAREQQRHINSIQMFYLVSEAYDVLSNPLTRAIYDSYGERGLKEGLPSPSSFIKPYAYHGEPTKTFREFFGTDNPFVDVLASSCVPIDYFAGNEATGFKPKETPIYRDVWTTLEELYTGCLKKVLVCKKVMAVDGNSVELFDKILTMPIEPGTPVGLQYTFPNEGDQGPNITPADINFIVRAKKHPVYVREGDNLVYHTSVNLCQALTGLTLPIKTLDGRSFNVAIVHIIHPGYEKIIKGEGMPIFGQQPSKGDMIIRFGVKYPNTLTQSQKKVTKDALDCGNEDPLDVAGGAGAGLGTCYSKRVPVTLTLPDERAGGAGGRDCACPTPDPPPTTTEEQPATAAAAEAQPGKLQ